MYAREELEIAEARLELVLEHEYTYTERTTSGRSTTSTHDVTTTDRTVHAAAVVSAPPTLRAGEQIDGDASLELPADAVPSGEGEITHEAPRAAPASAVRASPGCV